MVLLSANVIIIILQVARARATILPFAKAIATAPQVDKMIAMILHIAKVIARCMIATVQHITKVITIILQVAKTTTIISQTTNGIVMISHILKTTTIMPQHHKSDCNGSASHKRQPQNTLRQLHKGNCKVKCHESQKAIEKNTVTLQIQSCCEFCWPSWQFTKIKF